MFKKIIFIAVVAYLALHFQAYAMRRPQPETAGMQITPYQPTYNVQEVQRFQEALSLLNQHYWEAMRKNEYLPEYFYRELDRYYQQVPYNMSKIRNEFSKLKQSAEQLREPVRAPTPPLESASED